ncbi:MAG: hypothetical protein ACR2J8_02780 [Thermomicrobiales bacterium]
MPAGRAEVLSDHGGTVLASAGWGFGQAAGRVAMGLAIAWAREFGIAWIENGKVV